MLSWFIYRFDSRWVGIESTRCFPRMLCSLPFINNVQKIQQLISVFTVTNTLLVWKDVKKYLSISNTWSLKSPIALNPDFPTSIQNIGLLTWRSKGVSELGHLFDDGQLRSFQELRQEFSLPSKDFYKFLQIRHFLELQLKEGNIQFDLTEMEKRFFSSYTLKKKRSLNYTHCCPMLALRPWTL